MMKFHIILLVNVHFQYKLKASIMLNNSILPHVEVVNIMKIKQYQFHYEYEV
jgi:hypothetical protein